MSAARTALCTSRFIALLEANRAPGSTTAESVQRPATATQACCSEYQVWTEMYILPAPLLVRVHRFARLGFGAELHRLDLHAVEIAQPGKQCPARRKPRIGHRGALLPHPRHRGLQVTELHGEVCQPRRQRCRRWLELEKRVAADMEIGQKRPPVRLLQRVGLAEPDGLRVVRHRRVE